MFSTFEPEAQIIIITYFASLHLLYYLPTCYTKGLVPLSFLKSQFPILAFLLLRNDLVAEILPFATIPGVLFSSLLIAHNPLLLSPLSSIIFIVFLSPSFTLGIFLQSVRRKSGRVCFVFV